MKTAKKEATECRVNDRGSGVTWNASRPCKRGASRSGRCTTTRMTAAVLLLWTGQLGGYDGPRASTSTHLVEAVPRLAESRGTLHLAERIKKRRRPEMPRSGSEKHWTGYHSLVLPFEAPIEPEKVASGEVGVWETLRGGASAPTSKPKAATAKTGKKKSKTKTAGAKTGTKKSSRSQKKAKTSTADSAATDAKNVINQGLLKDAAQSMGDAIRDRADQLTADHTSAGSEGDPDESLSPASRRVYDSMQSVGYAMGASDRFTRLTNGRSTRTIDSLGSDTDETTDSNAGIEVASASVVVHYFLKSHGGAHALQCLCSVLAATAGVAAMILALPTVSTTSQRFSIQVSLLRRCMLFALIKHVSGVGAALYMAAVHGIPAAGFRQTVVWIQDLVANPVSQYVFYAALILVWLPSTTSTAAAALCWWQSYRLVPVVVAGPVVLREVISTALVVSDVLVLWAYSNDRSDEDDDSHGNSRMVQRGLTVAQSLVNAVMSVLVTPQSWRTATAVKRQDILAKLTSRVSLVFEVCVGLLLIVDAIWRGVAFLFLNSAPVAASTVKSGGSGGMAAWIKSVICARLYWQFLWTRRRKISHVLATMRGGAADMPLYVLTILEDPMAAMGITNRFDAAERRRMHSSDGKTRIQGIDAWTWKKYVQVAMGWDA